MADNMSRASTAGFLENHTLSRFAALSLPIFFEDWLKNPTEDWNVAYKLLDHVQNKLSSYNPK
jgi:hypothetical protein